MQSSRYPRAVQVWLLIGVFMVFMQIIIGGITRLTGSGLSITKWEIVTGTLPPLNAAQWEEAFDLYKATPQYAKINDGMSMGDFKFIFFWEYFHRLWGRVMGFAFLIPFIVFWRRGWLDKKIMRKLMWIIPMAGVVASFGWIMVASGLVNRPWVNAYKLTLHLSLALILFGYLWWTTLGTFTLYPQVIHRQLHKRWLLGIGVVAAIQILLGGVMSGMKAGLSYPTWPDMHGAFIPPVLLELSQWTKHNFVHYDQSLFMPALVQILHRSTAYLLTIIVLWYALASLRKSLSKHYKTSVLALLIALFVQVLLGIITVINCVGNIPVLWGVLHQGGAIVFLMVVLLLYFQVFMSSKNG